MTKGQPEDRKCRSRGSCQEPFQSSALRTKLGKQNRERETVQKHNPNPNTTSHNVAPGSAGLSRNQSWAQTAAQTDEGAGGAQGRAAWGGLRGSLPRGSPLIQILRLSLLLSETEREFQAKVI